MSKNKKKDFKPDPKADDLDGKIQVEGQECAGTVSPELKGPVGGKPEIQEIEEPKSAINTRRAAEVVTAGTDSSGIGGLRRGAIVFSGGAGRTQGDMSATTKEDAPYKSGDRAGRRADPITRKIDLIDAEIIKTKMYQSKPLAETTDGQGYNGNYHNEHAITQKNSGGAPADPLFERSVDEIDVDMLYYPAGQMNVPYHGKSLSIRSWDPTANSGAGGYSAATNFHIGNNFARKLTVKISNTGVINDFAFDTSDLSVPFIDEATYRLAGDAFLRMRNQSEIDRNVIISKAGNESDPSWSCIGDAVIDATDQNVMLRLLDAAAGNYVGLSARKLDEALALQLNKAAKDGSRITGPMAEMVNGCIASIGYGADASVSEANGRGYAFSAAAYVAGGAGLWLAVNDSLAKYTTKGKMLSLPLSFKAASAVAHANMDPLVMDNQLYSELVHNELFSTIDGPYDPVKPVVVTDKAAMITPLPIDVNLTGTLYDTTNKVLNDTVYVMHYENLRNRYNIKIKNFFISGIFRWFKERADRLYEACKSQAEDNEVTITIPIVSSATTISLWDLIVCQSVPYIVEERLKSFTEVLKYEKNFGYPYTGLVHLKDVDIHACDNYQFVSTDEQLVANVAKPVAAMKVIMPELFWPVGKQDGKNLETGHDGVAVFTVLPHYFVQNQFQYDKDNDTTTPRKLVLSNEGATIAYPTTRSGNMLSYLDTVYGMSEEDYRLSLDRMVVYPGYQPSYNTGSKIAKAAAQSGKVPLLAKVYKYGMTADGNPVIPYFAYADSTSHVSETLTVADVIGTPRELGLFQVAPAGLLTPIMNSAGSALNTVAVTSSFLGLSGPGIRAKVYHGVGNTMEYSILGTGSVNIDANASFRNDYKVVYATPASASTDIGFWFRAAVSSNTMTPFVSGAFANGVGTYDATTGIYASAETKDTDIAIKSDFKYMWPRLQRFPFVVNPFDCNTANLTSATTITAINAHDIYDFLYMFNFAGFRASDFRELAYQREKERIAKGMNYVIDPYVAKSMLLK